MSKKDGGTVRVDIPAHKEAGASEEAHEQPRHKGMRGRKKCACIFLERALPLVSFRDVKPGCGFLPQHENDTQPGMECQDAVADDNKNGKITGNVCWGACQGEMSGVWKIIRFLQGAADSITPPSACYTDPYNILLAQIGSRKFDDKTD